MKKVLKINLLTFMLLVPFITAYAEDNETIISPTDPTRFPSTETITDHNNYIYFLEDYYNPGQITNETSTKVGYYKRPEIGYIESSASGTQVTLKKDCGTDTNCVRLRDFYAKINALTETNSFNRTPIDITIANGTKKTCNLFHISDEETNHIKNDYFYHGCYSDATSSGLPDLSSLSSNIGDEGPTNYNTGNMACSSVIRNVTISEPIISSDYVAFVINREGPSDAKDVGTITDAQHMSNCTSNADNEFNAYAAYGDGRKYRSPVLVNFYYKTLDYNCEFEGDDTTGTCKENATLSRFCDRQTIIIDEGKTRADVKISQEATVVPEIEQSEIHQGGKIKIGFSLTNTITWEYVESQSTIKTESEIKEAIDNIIKNQYLKKNTDGIAIDFKIEGVKNEEYLKQIQERMNYNKDCSISYGNNMMQTRCDFYPPETTLRKYVGTIDMDHFGGTKSIENGIYSDINFSGNYVISADFTDVNMLEGGEPWTIHVNDTDSNTCSVEVYPKLYEPSDDELSVKFKPIYRPISIFDPFPNGRNPGVNWETFYAEQPDRLSESYLNSNLQFSVELNPNVIREIKTTITEPYSDWGGIDPVTKESEFVSKYFTTVRQHIPEDDK